ncbi:MAG: hypothetical protein QM811_07325 [Pirellulales bacterium]
MMDGIKNSPLPMEVRQVRMNPDLAKPSAPASSFGFGGESRGGGGGSVGTPGQLLPGDVFLEVRGIVYLAMPYDEKKMGAPSATEETPAPAEQVTAAPR